MPQSNPSATLSAALTDALALVGQATPGDWHIRTHPRNDSQFFVEAPRLNPEDPYDIEILGEDDTLYPTRRADAEAIVALMRLMRAHGPKLLEAAKRLEDASP